MSSESALEHTSRFHSKRSVMREKWRKLGAPRSMYQKNFVHKFFTPVVFYRSCNIGYTIGFSNCSPHPVSVGEFGIFPTAEAAIQAYKNPTDLEYVAKQQNARTPIISINLGRKILREDWGSVCDKIMLRILKYKFDQHPILKENLLNTGLRPIIQHTRADDFWGDGGDGSGENKLGKLLMKLREHYYNQISNKIS